ncbi:hypothetical protein VNO77_33700 [Canavalia gladiata]|uniref:Pre-mRNA-splicing factor Syf1/CRNKL1-like C-terminal HAT-repeats domain-containing protein n=1 Tax=Canavalia gladiata TaxID=3824 RepID=A0AAN9PYL1_CANGL
MRRATTKPSVEINRRVATDGNGLIQMKLHKSLRLWTFYVDFEESLVELAPSNQVKPLYLQYAKQLEEDYGLAKRAIKIYDQLRYLVHPKQGRPMSRQLNLVFQTRMSNYVFEVCRAGKSLGEIDWARGIYIFSSQFADPRSDPEFWNKWHEFEVQRRNEDIFREMLRTKRSVSTSYS